MELSKLLNFKNMQSWPWPKIIVGLIIFYIVWQTSQGKSLFEMFGLGEPPKDKDTVIEQTSQLTLTDKDGNKETIPVGSHIKTFVEKVQKSFITDKALPFYAWVHEDRCKISQQILAMDEKDLILANTLHQKSAGVSIRTTMSDVFEDPCSFWGESDYDLALLKLEKLKTY